MMKASLKPAKRPFPVTIACVVALAGMVPTLLALNILPRLIHLFIEMYGAWYALFWCAGKIVYLVCLAGYWRMRRWGVYLFIALTILKAAAYLAAGIPFTPVEILITAMLILPGLIYLKRMK